MKKKSDVLKYFKILLEAIEAEKDVLELPKHNEYGHPFDPEKDHIRGPRVVNISLTKSKAVFDVYRPKVGPKGSSVGMSHFHMEFDLTDA